jgi:hypothetical protein
MKRTCLLLLITVVLALPATAQNEATTEETTPAAKASSPWGIRVGLATDPDQVVGGVHFLETRIANNLYLEPNVEIGAGDDHLILAATAPFHYRFHVDAKVQPYAGGGVTIGFDRIDRPAGDDTNFEIAARATGGITWNLRSGTEMFAELNLIFGDLHDAQVMIGWRF